MLRPPQPRQAHGTIASLAGLGALHLEIAWSSHPGWIQECRELVQSFPQLHLGAASVCTVEAVEAARQAGFSYAVSPVLDPALLERSGPDLVVVPGVMTPSEVQRARCLGCALVKLFPAVSVGPLYWRRLAAPLGDPLPFCIAAGGLAPADVATWLAAGVDAVALGSRISGDPGADGALRELFVTGLP